MLPVGCRASSLGKRSIPPLQGMSFWVIPPDALFRMYLYDIVIQKRFDYMMCVFIAISCGQMICETPKMSVYSLEYKVLARCVGDCPASHVACLLAPAGNTQPGIDSAGLLPVTCHAVAACHMMYRSVMHLHTTSSKG